MKFATNIFLIVALLEGPFSYLPTPQIKSPQKSSGTFTKASSLIQPRICYATGCPTSHN